MSPIEHVSDALDRSVFQFLPISRNFAQPLKRSGPTFHRPQWTTWSTLCEGDVLHCVRQMVVTPDTDWFSEIETRERESFESVRDRGARIIWVSSGPRSANHLSQFGTAERKSLIIWVSSGPRSAKHLSQIETAERIIWVSSRPRSANCESFELLGTAERESFESVRDRGARIANHLSQFGTAERELRIIWATRDRGARIIWVSSGPWSANRESIESVRDRGAWIIWVSSGPRSANHLSQFGTAECESFESVQDRGARNIWVRSRLRSESFESVRDRGARIIWIRSGPRSANHLSQFFLSLFYLLNSTKLKIINTVG